MSSLQGKKTEMQMVTLPHASSRQRIAQAFDRGASEYLTLARAQHVMASRLFETLPTTLPDAAVVLDLGCGPGQWTRELACHYSTARCLGLDLSMAMLREASRSPDTPPRHMTPGNAQPPIHWLRGDAERLPVADNSLDLVFSSLAVQWCPTPRHWLGELARALKPGGRAHINTLGPGTLAEIRHAWQRQDDSVRHFPSREQLIDWARRTGLKVHCQTHRHVFHYPDVSAVMRSIKGIGAQTASGYRLTRADLAQASARHEALRTSQGLPVSYQVIELVMEKSVID